MLNKAVNYEKIAADYNRRYQKDHQQGTLKALRSILSEIEPKWVLEVGCGTCHWLEHLNDTEVQVLVGVDKAYRMLKHTKIPQNLLLCQGEAERIPLKSNGFEFIFCINAFHHFSEPYAFIRQAKKLLKPRGTLAITGMNPRDTRNRWYVYDFFEGKYARDLARFPDWPQVKRWLQEESFENIHLQDVEFIHDPKTSENVLDDPFLQKNGCSQLALLSTKAYQYGLNKLRKHIQDHAYTDYQYENDIVLSMLQAQKP